MSAAPEAKAVVVTRAENLDGPLSSHLKSLGLPVLLWPAVSITAAETGRLAIELARIQDFDWIVFASRQAVAAVLQRVTARPIGLRVAAVGQATAQVLNQRGWTVDLLPDDANAAGLVAAFEARLSRELAGNRTRGPLAPRSRDKRASKAATSPAALASSGRRSTVQPR